MVSKLVSYAVSVSDSECVPGSVSEPIPQMISGPFQELVSGPVSRGVFNARSRKAVYGLIAFAGRLPSD
jgi:hypothetical protein